MENKEVKILAEEISRVAKGMEELLSTGLKLEAIVALLQAMPGMNRMSKKKLMAILTNLKDLKKNFVNEKQLQAKLAINSLKK